MTGTCLAIYRWGVADIFQLMARLFPKNKGTPPYSPGPCLPQQWSLFWWISRVPLFRDIHTYSSKLGVQSRCAILAAFPNRVRLKVDVTTINCQFCDGAYMSVSGSLSWSYPRQWEVIPFREPSETWGSAKSRNVSNSYINKWNVESPCLMMIVHHSISIHWYTTSMNTPYESLWIHITLATCQPKESGNSWRKGATDHGNHGRCLSFIALHVSFAISYQLQSCWLRVWSKLSVWSA